jgi:hypothetical protein
MPAIRWDEEMINRIPIGLVLMKKRWGSLQFCGFVLRVTWVFDLD